MPKERPATWVSAVGLKFRSHRRVRPCCGAEAGVHRGAPSHLWDWDRRTHSCLWEYYRRAPWSHLLALNTPSRLHPNSVVFTSSAYLADTVVTLFEYTTPPCTEGGETIFLKLFLFLFFANLCILCKYPRVLLLV